MLFAGRLMILLMNVWIMKLRVRKLNWWRDEIDRLFKDEPQHPVSKALYPFIETL